MARPKKGTVKAPSKNPGVSGIKDIVTDSDPLWNAIMKRLQKTARVYGFSRVETPVLEHTETLAKYWNGDAAALLRAVLVEFGGNQMSIRPTLLPSVFRIYNQYKVPEIETLNKWLYLGNVLYGNAENLPVSGYEFGLEVFGTFTHLTEAQCISALWHMLQSLGLAELVLEINHLGTPQSQASYQEVLADYLRQKKFQLCDNCNESLDDRALNVFRCHNMECQDVLGEAPTILDFLDPVSQAHFTSILEAFDELQIPYQLNSLYAGPWGASKTNIAIRYKTKNDNILIGEAAYHTDVMQAVTGNNWPCFGFNGDLGNIYKAMQAAHIEVAHEPYNEVFLVPLGELASKKSLRLFRDLTTAQVSVYDHFGHVGVKNQLKQAQAYKAPIALIMGQKEAMDDMVILRDVKSGMQEIFSYDKIVAEVKKRLGR